MPCRESPGHDRVALDATPQKAEHFPGASSSAVEQGTLNPLVVGSNPSWLTDHASSHELRLVPLLYWRFLIFRYW